MSYIDPDTGFESEKETSKEASAAVRLATASHIINTESEDKVIKAYQSGLISREEAGRALIALKKIIRKHLGDNLVCACGNIGSSQGFYACNALGGYVEPDENWSPELYKCDRCGQLYEHVEGGV